MDTCRCTVVVLLKHFLMSENSLLFVSGILGFQYTSVKEGGIF